MSQQELELPQGWVETKLENVISHSTEKFDPLIQPNQIFIGLKHIEKNSGEINGKGNSKETKSLKTIFHQGDILYGKLRPYFNKICIPNFNGVCSTDILVFQKNKLIENKFLKFFLMGNNFVSFCTQNMTGTQYPRISYKKISEFIFLLPPLNEQKRIASKIEELFSKINYAKQSLEHTKLQLEQYRKSLLVSAFEGKLTEQWRKENKINENSENSPLGDLILFSKNGFTGKPNELKKGMPRLGIETITQSDSIYIDESMHKFIEISKSQIDRYRAKIGDLFVCRQNGNQNYVGKCAVFKEIISPMIFSDSLIQFRINTKLMSSTYLAFFLNSHLGRRQIEKFCSTTAGNFSINGTNFKKIMIQYPSLLEQQKIISQIEQDFSLIENTIQIVESSLQNLETMKMSVLKQAFEGKLVPQDPNDEPASVLLEKIKSTKESQTTKQRGMKNVK